MYEGVVTPSVSYGYGTWSGWTAPEAAPNITSVTLPSAGTEVVSWAAPVPFKAGDAGSSVTGYVVSATNTTTGAVVSQTLAANVLTYTFTGLPTGSTYTVSVAATNSLGTGPASQVTGSKASLAVPGAPKITSVTPTSSSLAISWSAPTTTGGSAITGYLVSVTAGNVTVTCGTVAATATTCTIPGLSASTAYTVSVSAENANGPGTAATSTGTTSASSGGGAKPSNITVTFAAGSTALTAAAKNALVALAQKLTAGAMLTLTGYAKGNVFLAKSRATTVALFLEAAVSNLKFQLHEVTTSTANAVTVVTVSN
jgi:outer membrane protein OmpA-like peptidoglycan-associated protein